MKDRRNTTDALEIIHNRFYKGRPDRQKALEAEELDLKIAEQIYSIRCKAKLTQKQLAEKIGTTPSVISRLESADYKGHSLSMLNRIAFALDKRVEVRIVPIKKKK